MRFYRFLTPWLFLASLSSAGLCGPLARIYVVPNRVVIGPLLKQQFRVFGQDAQGNETAVNGPVVWSTPLSLGTITQDGLFAAAKSTGFNHAAVTVTAAGGLVGVASVSIETPVAAGGYRLAKHWGMPWPPAPTSVSEVVFDSSGRVCVVDAPAGLARKYDRFGNYTGDQLLQRGSISTVPTRASYHPGGYFVVYDAALKSVVALKNGWSNVTPAGNTQTCGGLAHDPNGGLYVLEQDPPSVSYIKNSYPANAQWGSTGSGDGQFANPTDIAVAGDGTVYVCDAGNHRIQKFEPLGQFLMKWGKFGSEAGDFSSPTSVTIISDGSVLVLDAGNNRVQVFDSAGGYVSQWFVVTPETTGSSLARIRITTDGCVYIADQGRKKVLKFDLQGNSLPFEWDSDINGRLKAATGICADTDGNIYCTETATRRVNVFDPEGGFVRGFSTPPLQPDMIEVSPLGQIVVCSRSGGTLAGFDPTGGMAWTTGTNDIGYIGSIGIDSGGAIHALGPVDDIYRFGPDGTQATSVAPPTSGDGALTRVSGMAVDRRGFIYAVGCSGACNRYNLDMEYQNGWNCSPNHECARALDVDSSGNVLIQCFGTGTVFSSHGESAGGVAVATSGDAAFHRRGSILTTAEDGIRHYYRHAEPLAIRPDNVNIVTGSDYRFEASSMGLGGTRIEPEWWWVDEMVGSIDSIGTLRAGPTAGDYPDAVCASLLGWQLRASVGVMPVQASGGYVMQRKWWNRNTVSSGSPYGVAIDQYANLFLTHSSSCQVRKYARDGRLLLEFGSRGSYNGQFQGPMHIAVDRQGSIYVADVACNVQKFDSEGRFLLKWGSSGSGNGQFKAPRGIAVDKDGFVYVSDGGTNRIQRFTSGGAFVSAWGVSGSAPGQLSVPAGVSISEDDRSIWVADSMNHRIQQFTKDGLLMKVVGSAGTAPGQFNRPVDVCEDKDGNLFTIEQSKRVQKFNRSGLQLADWYVSDEPGKGSTSLKHVGVDQFGGLYLTDSIGDRTLLYAPVSSINSRMRTGTSGTGVALAEVVVSAGTEDMGDCFYVQTRDGTTGMRVNGLSAARGSVVNVTGRLTIADGECVLSATSVTQTGTGTASASGVRCDQLGGGANGCQPAMHGWRWVHKRGVPPHYSWVELTGTSNTGLLARVAGLVLSVDAEKRSFVLTDGSCAGIDCLMQQSLALPDPGSCVIVTGISSCRLTPEGDPVPLLRVRDPVQIVN